MAHVKICCISSPEEAALAIAAGASALGLVSEMPSGPGVIPETRIRAIAASVPEGIDTFLLTSLVRVPEIVEQARRCGTTTVQLVDRLERGGHDDLRRSLPGVRVVQVVHVTGPDAVAEAVTASRSADALLLDSGNPEAAVKELGGTGRVHDWGLSARIRERVDVPVYLAGGLTADNAAAALSAVRPYALDVCSGVRTDGRLDADKLVRFVLAASAGA